MHNWDYIRISFVEFILYKYKYNIHTHIYAYIYNLLI